MGFVERLRYFDQEPSTGFAWSFLDFLEEAYRIDRGHRAESFEALVAAAEAEMPLVASHEGVSAFWSEAASDAAEGHRTYRDRARISVHRSWLNGQEQLPYVDRVRGFIEQVNREVEAQGYRVELAGGLELAALAERRIRETQWGSFGGAFGVVAVTLWALLWSSPGLATLATLCNLLPVLALLGVMGWLGIAVDPANTKVAAVLISINDDDTIHMSLRYQRERVQVADELLHLRNRIRP